MFPARSSPLEKFLSSLESRSCERSNEELNLPFIKGQNRASNATECLTTRTGGSLFPLSPDRAGDGGF